SPLSPPAPHSSPTRRSSDLRVIAREPEAAERQRPCRLVRAEPAQTVQRQRRRNLGGHGGDEDREESEPARGVPEGRQHGEHQERSEEHTSELQSREKLVCRL